MRHQPAHDSPPAQAGASAAVRRALGRAVLAWYAQSRRDLPWRRTQDPYAIWLSEVMLQQTRVETVVPYFARFLRAYPTVDALARAPLDDVLAAWAGLGYYRRARMLHAGAQHVARALGGELPRTADELREIPGIGPYTAGAVASIAFGCAAPVVDGNVARVLARIFAVEDDLRGGAGLGKIWRIAGELVAAPPAARDPGAWNQALMELGATVCVPREPRCAACPARDACLAFARGIQRELPRLKAKARPTLERRTALVATCAGGVVLARRREDGRFGGMWEPPSVEGDDAAPLSTLTGARPAAIADAGRVTHVLSHRRLEVVVKTARLERPPANACPSGGEYDRIAVIDEHALARTALTKLARKILHAADLAASGASPRRKRTAAT